jgi:hypothetical protein
VKGSCGGGQRLLPAGQPGAGCQLGKRASRRRLCLCCECVCVQASALPVVCVRGGPQIPPQLLLPLPAGGPGGALGLVLERSRALCGKTYRKPALHSGDAQVGGLVPERRALRQRPSTQWAAPRKGQGARPRALLPALRLCTSPRSAFPSP